MGFESTETSFKQVTRRFFLQLLCKFSIMTDLVVRAAKVDCGKIPGH